MLPVVILWFDDYSLSGVPIVWDIAYPSVSTNFASTKFKEVLKHYWQVIWTIELSKHDNIQINKIPQIVEPTCATVPTQKINHKEGMCQMCFIDHQVFHKFSVSWQTLYLGYIWNLFAHACVLLFCRIFSLILENHLQFSSSPTQGG